jgi:hypothetical protein
VIGIPPVVNPPAPAPPGIASRIAGLPVLKGAVLYGATLTFAALYADFMANIFSATDGTPPVFDAALVTTAAALAGILGSAFALAIGVPTTDASTNSHLGIKDGKKPKTAREKLVVLIRKIFSIDPSAVDKASWPMTFGVWAYAIVGTAVAITYVLNPGETPEAIKALAVAFAGYAVALVTTAYGLSK